MTTTETSEHVRAQAKWVRTSPRKARLVAEHIRGRSVPEARTVLAFTPRAAAREIEKVLASAVANAEANHGLIGDDLYVRTTVVDEGPMLKRWRARARGRVARIRKRMCHITVELAPAPQAPVRVRGPVEGVRGNREVPPRTKKAAKPKAKEKPAAEEPKTEKPKRRAPARKKKTEEAEG